jgi:glycosyltransferase involved in cell wall biosynthesis
VSTRLPLSVQLVGLLAAGHSGVPRYAEQLIRALDALAPTAPDVAYTLLTTPSAGGHLALENIELVTPRLLRRRILGLSNRVLLEQLTTAVSRADVLYFFDLMGPLLAPRKRFVATVHDATAGRRLTDAKWAYKRLAHPWAARHAQATIAVSDFARREAIDVYGAPADRVFVVRSGPGLHHGSPAPQKAGEPVRRGFLYVGNFGRNKNVQLLTRAFEQSKADGPLILVGRSGGAKAEVEALAAASTRTDGIELLDQVEDDGLEQLYATSTAFLFPSLYEGFGFPPLEAMSRGCPVVTSDIPALRETLGDGALFLPAEEPGPWARAMERLERDAALRSDLRGRGLANVQRFSWTETARGVTDVLRGLRDRLPKG